MPADEPPEIAALREAVEQAVAASETIVNIRDVLVAAGWQLELTFNLAFVPPQKLSAEVTDADRRIARDWGIDA